MGRRGNGEEEVNGEEGEWGGGRGGKVGPATNPLDSSKRPLINYSRVCQNVSKSSQKLSNHTVNVTVNYFRSTTVKNINISTTRAVFGNSSGCR